MPHVNNMEQLLKKLAGCWHESAAGGDVARLELYQAITAKGLSGDDEESTSRAFERQRGAILRVLSSCDDIQKSALELLGHIVAMASSCEGPACQPSQASSLWMAVARVLDGEDSKRMVKVMALFAIAKNTMAPDLVAPSVAQLAPAVAQTMRMESTVARQQSAMAIHSLLGSVPGAMARCDPGRADRPEEEDSFWVRCLLRLCFDDAVKVRADALKAAERAVSLGGLRGNAGIAAWVLEALRDGRLSQGMSRVLFYDASSQSQATVPGAAGEADPLPHALGSSSTAAAPDRTNPRQATPQRVKHAIRVWAVHLSLADPTRLLRAKDSAGKKRLLDVGTGLFTWLSGKSADGRDDVKVQAVESWEMFAVSMMAQIGREEAKKVAHMFLRALSRWVLKEK
ncbi:hypothetical protein Esi_0024_0150 [Ectocarpus siliculosus]|uniref:Uncharacterized protein n=1 Tax=Ectocarpus siliculosus TaxID=2880 RepID=D8LJ94_ECTSI|nr:hypothetical protein Esi_0024_0150 [Ectocarpus siliculosus]|eukprot:CBN76978.1 hypothetical protein Esi_0024_0150 [Ectocarpus siliculosus]